MIQIREYVTDGETLFEATYDVHVSSDQSNYGCDGPVGALGDRRPIANSVPTLPGRAWRYVRSLVDARSEYAVHDDDLLAVHGTTWSVRPV